MIVFDNIVYRLQKAGGISVYWTEMCRRLIKDQTFEKLFIEDVFSKSNIFRQELDIPTINIYLKKNFLFKLSRYFDVNIHLKNKFIFHSSYFRLCSNKNAINVTTVHDFIYEKHSRWGPKRLVHSFIKKRAIRKSDAIICVSESTKRDLIEYIPNVDIKKVYVIYLSVSNCFFPLTVLNFDTPFPKNKYLLFVGQRKGYKGFMFAVKVAKFYSINLLFVGGGSLSNAERLYLKSHLSKDSFIHVGNISSNRLNELYNNALCLFYPSTYEGFGLPLIEAQKAGCPVIAYRGSSIIEVVENSALLIEEHTIEAVKKHIALLNDPIKRAEIIEKGLINTKRFSWDQSYEKLISVYNKLL